MSHTVKRIFSGQLTLRRGATEQLPMVNCSAVFDPVPDLHWVLEAVKKDADFVEWCVDEEGKLVYMHVWNLDAVKVQLHVFTKCRENDISWHFVMDRDAFIAELDAAYVSFGAQGGWGVTWNDWAREDGRREDVLIDDGRI